MKREIYTCDRCGKETEKRSHMARVLIVALGDDDQHSWHRYRADVELCDSCLRPLERYLKKPNSSL